MPNVSVSIGGYIVSTPGVYYQDLIAPLVPSNIPTGPLLFIAPSYGGVPFTPMNFTDPNSLSAAMRGAPAIDYVNFMFNPSQQLAGTQLVTLINPAPNTQSSLALLSSGSATNVINLTSTNYGSASNLLQLSVTDSSFIYNGHPIGKQITLYDNFSNVSQEGNNLGVPFQIAYTGTSNSVTYAVASSGGNAVSLIITSPNIGESVTMDLTSTAFGTVSQLVDYLNGTGYYVAIVYGDGSLPTYYLDNITSTSLPAPTPPAGPGLNSVFNYVNITATLGAVVWWFNTSANALATATLASGIPNSGNPTYGLQNSGLEYFTGGANVVPSIANYSSGFNAGLTTPAWAVIAVPPTSDQLASIDGPPLAVFKYNVDLLGVQHAQTASTLIYRKWRRYVTGSILGEPAYGATYSAQSNAISYNSYSTTYVWPGIQATNIYTGLNQVWNGHHVAAGVAGMMTGNPVNTPLTNKTMTGNGVEQPCPLGTQNILQNSGVQVLIQSPDTAQPTLLSDVTTWQNDDNNANVFNQQVSCRFGLAYSFTRSMLPYVGIAVSPLDVARARNTAVALLNSLIYNGSNAGILTSWQQNTLVLTFNSNNFTLTVTVNVALVGQIRFIPITVTISPPNLLITATVNSVTETNI